MDPSTNNSAMSSGSHHSPEPPRLCARDCGFYGTAENRGLCSKCYTDFLKEHMFKSKAATTEVSVLPSDQSNINNDGVLVGSVESLSNHGSYDSSDSIPTICAPQVVKNRCVACKKKVGLLGFECRCGGTFCGTHRYPESHSCKHDFKTAARIALEKENPVCQADKIKDRV